MNLLQRESIVWAYLIFFDGQRIAPQLRGGAGIKREWIYNQLAAMRYVREAGWKLNEKGELCDMSDAPFAETLVAASADTEVSKAARKGKNQ